MIILTSGLFEVYDKLPLDNVKKVAFIGNAKDKHIDKSGLEKYRKFFKDKGFEVEDIDLRKYKKRILFKKLSASDLIYVAGGNCFVLLEEMRKSGFDKIIRKLLDDGVIYLGQSAGSSVMGSSIEPLQLMDSKPDVTSLKNFDGLGFVDFVFVPHYKSEKYAEKVKNVRKKYSNKHKLEFFTDSEGLIIDNNSIKKIK
ncbi:MAG: peptidase E [Nanoarchaeota archaeon]|nr:peptidase E [Nanoarchaeota archaeon]MBU1977419.1 peptidase E [Nanoarchaeota archaeon]